MPYIEGWKRLHMDKVIKMMIQVDMKVDGDLNYVLYKFCKDHIRPSYNNYKNYIGELEECVAEIRRRILAPYEDQKRFENGEV